MSKKLVYRATVHMKTHSISLTFDKKKSAEDWIRECKKGFPTLYRSSNIIMEVVKDDKAMDI